MSRDLREISGQLERVTKAIKQGLDSLHSNSTLDSIGETKNGEDNELNNLMYKIRSCIEDLKKLKVNEQGNNLHPAKQM